MVLEADLDLRFAMVVGWTEGEDSRGVHMTENEKEFIRICSSS